jgi:hypothetical protein
MLLKGILKRFASHRRSDIEHSDYRADGDVVAEQADAFEEFGVAEFIFHSLKQFIWQLVLMH